MQTLLPTLAACMAIQAMALLFPTMLWVLICSPPALPLINPAGSCKLFPTLQAVSCSQEVFAQAKSCHVLLFQPCGLHISPHNEEGEPAASPSARPLHGAATQISISKQHLDQSHRVRTPRYLIISPGGAADALPPALSLLYLSPSATSCWPSLVFLAIPCLWGQ